MLSLACVVNTEDVSVSFDPCRGGLRVYEKVWLLASKRRGKTSYINELKFVSVREVRTL